MSSDMGGFAVASSACLIETEVWAAAVIAAGGTLPASSKQIGDNLLRAIKASTFVDKLRYLMPFLGSNLTAALVPIILRGASNPVNTGFVSGDFTEPTGLANAAEGTKYLNTGVLPSSLGTTMNGGLGFWELNWGAGSNVEPIGAYDSSSNRFVIDGRPAVRAFRWGNSANAANDAGTFSNGHYYGQRSSATLRQLFKDGLPIVPDNTTSDSGGTGNRSIVIMGSQDSTGVFTPWKGRCGCAYMTDGTMTVAEIAAFHLILKNTLMAPLSRL